MSDLILWVHSAVPCTLNFKIDTVLVRRALVLAIVLFLITPLPFLRAEKYESPSKEFSIDLPKDWIQLSLPFQNVVVSYGKKGTLATFHITKRDLGEIRVIEQLKWADLFSPEFRSIDIHMQNTILLGGEKAKFCVYTLKPGEFKKNMEGKLSAKYINYVLIHQGKLFSITFKDTEDGFPLTYPSFLAVIRTLQFDTSKSASPRKSI